MSVVSQATLEQLEPGMRDSLVDVHNKALKKVILQPDLLEEDIDDTLLV